MNRLFGPIPSSALHLVVDMQELFRSHPEWGTQSVTTIIPPIQRLLAARPENAFFSRFIPPQHADQANGTWRRFYRRWSSVTLDRLDPMQIEIVHELRPWAKRVADKPVYSALANAELKDAAVAAGTVILTGAETDVCVLATAIGAVEEGLRVILAADALTSASQACHAKALDILHDRLDEQIEVATVEQIITTWK